jgi:hypothetical protein
MGSTLLQSHQITDEIVRNVSTLTSQRGCFGKGYQYG